MAWELFARRTRCVTASRPPSRVITSTITSAIPEYLQPPGALLQSRFGRDGHLARPCRYGQGAFKHDRDSAPYPQGPEAPLAPAPCGIDARGLEFLRVAFRGAEVTRNVEKALKTGSRRAFMSLLAHARLHERLRGGAGGGIRAESRCGRAARRLASNYALNDNATV